MAKILLENTTAQPYELEEYHQYVCARRDECKCAIERVVGPKGKLVAKRHPKSWRLGAFGKVGPLDAEVLFVPFVARLVKTGILKRIDVADAAPVKEN